MRVEEDFMRGRLRCHPAFMQTTYHRSGYNRYTSQLLSRRNIFVLELALLTALAGGLLIKLATSIAIAADNSGVPDVRTLARAVDEHYNHLRTLEAEFTEVYRGSGMERTETGTLLLKKPGKMRWEYRSPKEKLFVSDGHEAWFYVPDDRQARKTSVSKLDDIRSPLALLLGKTKLQKELHGLSLAPDISPLDPADVVLRGVPQALADRVSEIVLEITPGHQISRITINEVDGSGTEYRFSQQKENVQISEGKFQFRPPAGTETVEGVMGP
jgi:outer membrane lipoprotein carrier protein